MKAARQEMPIEVEAQSLEQVDEAVAAGADIILVDNLSIDEIREAVRRIGGRAKVEMSGGVTLDRIPELARTGADYVSVGALTHSAPGRRSELRARSRRVVRQAPLARPEVIEATGGMSEPLPEQIWPLRARAPTRGRGADGSGTRLLFSGNRLDQRRGGGAGRARRARRGDRRRGGADGRPRPVRARRGSRRRARDSMPRSCAAMRPPRRC